MCAYVYVCMWAYTLVDVCVPYFTSARGCDRMELLINKFKRSCFLPMSAPSASTLTNETDLRLFRAVTQDPNHVLCKLNHARCSVIIVIIMFVVKTHPT